MAYQMILSLIVVRNSPQGSGPVYSSFLELRPTFHLHITHNPMDKLKELTKSSNNTSVVSSTINKITGSTSYLLQSLLTTIQPMLQQRQHLSTLTMGTILGLTLNPLLQFKSQLLKTKLLTFKMLRNP